MTNYCHQPITQGRYAGRTCVNAVPCRDPEHRTTEIRNLAREMSLEGPEYLPYERFLSMARDLYVNGVKTRLKTRKVI
jgi:hypothetical protein